ncbi:hypothetical protein A2988_03220 [Candidatus Azambacteria bacterium RIFCSPLOWO2_01_FULL_46_25]|uniref:SHS2 domain-containing protein n=1 Tax=Candidatus Azambacteria bacterium RIFCSPLOWO2_01_FULL_46_25 TaxID=1797298 RepID=A0A1F5BV75_9BACT|nr:MAG: hypothetical protein A2988_03220 [Candidatus Azambacteria bacterium RIFCSPLOWO2_01_FULL_46_25]OGD38012.1 MAG: hypothetical protein A2850_02880 [Candidatus Azambacteria bacterium RIFCSPHIGHO2_01_FULL_51_74]
MFRFLSKNIYEVDPDAFGLDISDESFKFVQLKPQRHGAVRLTAFGFGDLPKGAIIDGEIKDQEEVVQTLRAALQKPTQGKLSTNHVVCSLPEEHTFTRVVQLPNMGKAEIGEAIQWEIEQNIPMSIADVYYDWQVVDLGAQNVNHLDILISAAPQKLIDGYVSMLRACNMLVKSLEGESVAVSRALVKNLHTDGPSLIVDLGATRTSFIIFSGSALQFTSSIPLAGNKMIGALEAELKVDHQEAKRLFYDAGLDQNQEGGKAYAVLEPIVKDLTEQIRNYIVFYEGHAMHEHVSDAKRVVVGKISLCGGVSNLNGLAVYLAMALKIPVEIGNPWANILKEPLREIPGLPFKKSLSYTTALGLGLSGIRKNTNYAQ